MARIALAAGLLFLTPGMANAQDYDWHNKSNQITMNGALVNTGKVCAGAFGFTPISPLPEPTMADKIDAYLLLNDTPDTVVQSWALEIIRPANAILDKKSNETTANDDRSAAAAAIAASEDPSAFAQAEEKYIRSAMAPFQRALDACAVGARDAFIGKYYWTGSGSTDAQEREMRAWFPEFVAGLKSPKTKQKH